MMWIESGLDDLSEAANKIKLELFDKESELLSVVLAATVSPKFISK